MNCPYCQNWFDVIYTGSLVTPVAYVVLVPE